MLTIFIPETEQFNQKTNEFFTTKAHTLVLEHSLVSISKWESKWQKPFLTGGQKTMPETLDYIKCMTLTQNVDPNVYNVIPKTELAKIHDYVGNPMTATTFSDTKNNGRSREVITSELIYYWMIASNIPFECQKWHINRLLTLIRVCSIKNGPQKKMSKAETMRSNAQLNAARRKALHSHG